MISPYSITASKHTRKGDAEDCHHQAGLSLAEPGHQSLRNPDVAAQQALRPIEQPNSPEGGGQRIRFLAKKQDVHHGPTRHHDHTRARRLSPIRSAARRIPVRSQGSNPKQQEQEIGEELQQLVKRHGGGRPGHGGTVSAPQVQDLDGLASDLGTKREVAGSKNGEAHGNRARSVWQQDSRRGQAATSARR